MVGFICEVTPSCNLKCTFCYNSWRDPNIKSPKPLAADEFIPLLINTLTDAKASWLAFAGGEPLLYPDLAKLMKAVKQALPHVSIGLASNGTLLTSKRLAFLIDNGLDYVELSLFSSSANHYKNLTGANLLDRSHQAILTVKSYQLPLTVACTLVNSNIDQLEKIILTAFTLGADAFALNPFTPTGYGRVNQAELELSRSQLKHSLAIMQNVAQRVPIPLTVTLPIEDCVIPHANYPNLLFSSCQCANGKWVIDPQGYLRTCEQNPQPIGHLAINSFTKLSQLKEVKQFQNHHRKPECNTCGQFSICGGGCRFRET